MITERPEEVRDAAYYDKHYAEETPKHYLYHLMAPVWSQVAEFVKQIPSPKIIDLGCGSGGMAHMLKDMGFTVYLGIDFSPEAIARANKRVDARFKVDDITTGNWAKEPHNTVIAIETLEHLADDLGLVRMLAAGTHILFSVPNLNCAGHVRWFGSHRQVYDRYSQLLEFQKTEVFVAGTAKWFVVHGIRKEGF